MGKIYNIIKYIIRLTGRREDFTKNQAKACIKDDLFNQAKLLLIKDGGVW